MEFTEQELNGIFGFVQSHNFLLEDGLLITDKLLKECKEEIEEEGYESIYKLKGYIVKVEIDGDHRNDGQIVDYTFIFISPTNEITEISTEMCLMVGWNYCGNEIIK